MPAKRIAAMGRSYRETANLISSIMQRLYRAYRLAGDGLSVTMPVRLN
ncbi:hypothetical protein [Pseudomonas sp.]|nr:hypothetical protein [Pseudomonas sp.]MDP2746824.1 hypothetical protein [Pseudomonas sp.]